ncbi:MAG: DUF5665 domain-containing protein [Peptococcaceae bacterium]|nr:DUF5665 domain-containing protein [Peptococcaceae bacterium]
MEQDKQNPQTVEEQSASPKRPIGRLLIKASARRKYRVRQKKTIQQSMVDSMERTRLAEYAMYFEQPWRLLGINFLIGLSRGLGATLGLALVLSLLVYLAQQVISANLPGISQWIADLINIVNSYNVG